MLNLQCNLKYINLCLFYFITLISNNSYAQNNFLSLNNFTPIFRTDTNQFNIICFDHGNYGFEPKNLSNLRDGGYIIYANSHVTPYAVHTIFFIKNSTYIESPLYVRHKKKKIFTLIRNLHVYDIVYMKNWKDNKTIRVKRNRIKIKAN